MNKFTKIIIGTGLAVAALGAIAAPANAATSAATDTSIQAQGDRVTGVASFYTGEVPQLEGGYWSTGKSPIVQVAAWAGVPQLAWEFPAVGTEGPISGTGALDGKCATSTTPPNVQTHITWAACDGSADQQFKLVATTEGTVSGYQIELVSKPGNYLFPWSVGTAGSTMYLGNYPEYHHARWILTNYDSLTPVAPAVTPVDITGPAANETVDLAPNFSGTGEPGASVVVKDAAGNQLCTVTVAADGTWACTSTVDLPEGPTTITAEQTDANGGKTTDTVDVIVVKGGPAGPIIAPAVAAGAVGLGALISGGVIAIRRKKA